MTSFQFPVKNISPVASIILASIGSLILTYLTIRPPLIPTDWARLNANGVYVPVRVDYAWPSYVVQVGLWVTIIVISCQLSVVSKREKQRERQDFHRKGAEDAESKNKKTNYILWMVAGITLVGFGLRVQGLDSLPLIIDEIGFAAHASDILHGQQVPIFAPGHNANPSVYSWLMAGIMAVLGQNTFAMRLLPLVFGTLSIPAIYVLGREWWSRRVGVLAAIFLATFPAHIYFSRMSLYNIVDPFFAMLALAFLARGMRFQEQRRYWIVAGMMAGIAQYFYHGSRLVLVLMAVYVVSCQLSVISFQFPEKSKEKTLTAEAQRTQRKEIKNKDRQIKEISRWWSGVLWMVFAFGVVAMPRFAPMLVNRLPVTGNEQALHLPADFAANSLRSVLAWVGEKDVSPFWLSSAPLLQWLALPVFGMGVVVCLWQWRDGRSWVMLLSIGLTTLFGGAIWAAAPLYVRYMTAVPAIGLLVAVGSHQLSVISFQFPEKDKVKGKEKIFTTEVQRSESGGRGKRYTVLQMVLIGLIAVQGIDAAGQQTEEALGNITASQWTEQDLARQAAALPAGTHVVVVVTDGFSEIQRITLAHYVAAYGERRAIMVNQNGEKTLAEQVKIFDQMPYVILKPSMSQ